MANRYVSTGAYVKTPEQQAVLQKLILKDSAGN